MPPKTHYFIGEQWGLWKIIGEGNKTKHGRYALCEHTVTLEKKEIQYQNLRLGFIKGTGRRLRNEDIIGKKFGKLTAVSFVSCSSESGSRIFKFKCDCGNIKDIVLNRVTNGYTKSCGCLQVFNNPKFGEEHSAWKGGFEKSVRYKKYPIRNKILKWSFYILNKFNFTCQKCGVYEGPIFETLNAHHLYPVNSHFDKALDFDNGICLCKICHDSFHQKYSKFNNTPEQIQEFIGK